MRLNTPILFWISISSVLYAVFFIGSSNLVFIRLQIQKLLILCIFRDHLHDVNRDRFVPGWKSSRARKKFVYIRGFTWGTRDESNLARDKHVPLGNKFSPPVRSVFCSFVPMETVCMEFSIRRCHAHLAPKPCK